MYCQGIPVCFNPQTIMLRQVHQLTINIQLIMLMTTMLLLVDWQTIKAQCLTVVTTITEVLNLIHLQLKSPPSLIP